MPVHGDGLEDNVRSSVRWTRSSVLAAIHRLQEDGRALTYESSEAIYPGIYEGARTVCGSWAAALELAGCSRR